MTHEIFDGLRQLSDDEMRARLRSALHRMRADSAELIAHLAEVEVRGLHLEEGYSSMFAYCTRALGFSEAGAYNRIEAARAARRFPVILDLLTAGAVHMTAVRMLASHLTEENHVRVLEAARGKTKMQLLELVAALDPKPDVASSLRRLPLPPAPTPQALVTAPAAPAATGPAATVPNHVSPPASVVPLSPYRYRLQVTIGGNAVEKLRLAQDLLRHALPSGDPAVVVERALDALLDILVARKFAATQAPRPSAGSDPHSRHIDAAVKRAVTLRDRGRCAFVGRDGHRCNERAFVEFHHRDRPYAEGGGKGVHQIEIRCARHNRYESNVFRAARNSFQAELDVCRVDACRAPAGTSARSHG